MIKPEQIPDDAVMPIAMAIYEATTGLKPGDELYEDDGYAYHWEEAINTLAAAINAWPEAFEYRSKHAIYGQCLTLPLSQENNDD